MYIFIAIFPEYMNDTVAIYSIIKSSFFEKAENLNKQVQNPVFQWTSCMCMKCIVSFALISPDANLVIPLL
jgi:hypothetical protein